jgi:hypothetical protein
MNKSLRMLKESQASFLNEASITLKYSMEEVNDSIDNSEKKLDKLNKEESSAVNDEDYIKLRDIKHSQLTALSNMIEHYKAKMVLLDSQKESLEAEIEDMKKLGAGVFNNQELDEFAHESFKKGWVLRIETDDHYINLVKLMDETNNYKLVDTNIPGLKSGYVFVVPNLKVAHGAVLKGYRPLGGNKYQDLDKPVNIQKINRLIKNPK